MIADLAVIAVTVIGLANVAANYRVQMKVADRLRIVSPPKAPAKQSTEVAGTVEELDRRRSA